MSIQKCMMGDLLIQVQNCPPPPPVIPPPALNCFGNPSLSFLALALYIDRGVAKEKVVAIIGKDLYVAGVRGTVVCQVPLASLTKFVRQSARDDLSETLVLGYRTGKGQDNTLSLQFASDSSEPRYHSIGNLQNPKLPIDKILEIACRLAPPSVPVAAVGSTAASILATEAGMRGVSNVTAGPSSREGSPTPPIGVRAATPNSKKTIAVLEAVRNDLRAPAPSVTFQAESSPDVDQYRQRIIRMYSKYCPERLQRPNAIEEALVTFKGEEECLIRSLVKKYGPEPIIEQQAEESAGSAPLLDNTDECAHLKEQQPQTQAALSTLMENNGGGETLLSEQSINENDVQLKATGPTSDPSQYLPSKSAKIVHEVPDYISRFSHLFEDPVRDGGGEAFIPLDDAETIAEEWSRRRRQGQKDLMTIDDVRTEDVERLLSDLHAAEDAAKLEAGEIHNGNREAPSTPAAQISMDERAEDVSSGDTDAESSRTTEKQREGTLSRVASSDGVRLTPSHATILRSSLRALQDAFSACCKKAEFAAAHSLEDVSGNNSSPGSHIAFLQDLRNLSHPLASMFKVLAPLCDAAEGRASSTLFRTEPSASWAVVDLGEVNRNVFPPAPKRYYRMLIERRCSQRRPSQKGFLGLDNAAENADCFSECGAAYGDDLELLICTHLQRQQNDGGWIIPYRRIQNVCPGAVPHLSLTLSEARSPHPGSCFPTGSSSHVRALDDCRSFTLVTANHTIVVELECQTDRDKWLRRIHEVLLARFTLQVEEQAEWKKLRDPLVDAMSACASLKKKETLGEAHMSSGNQNALIRDDQTFRSPRQGYQNPGYRSSTSVLFGTGGLHRPSIGSSDPTNPVL